MLILKKYLQKSLVRVHFGGRVREFHFKGNIPASKSLFNRALIAKSYYSKLKISGSTSCDDVAHLEKSLNQIKTEKSFNCGEGGTTLRFLAFRLSREKGHFVLKGTSRLLSRPQVEIKNILSQLGVEVRVNKTNIQIISNGWIAPKKSVVVQAKDSSQFLSALFLNSWGLDFDLKVKVVGGVTSQSYLDMTLVLLNQLGLRYQKRGNFYIVPKGQKVLSKSCRVESDMSSIFSVAAFGALFGGVEFLDFPKSTIQPDKQFLHFFEKMNVPVKLNRGVCKIKAAKDLRSLRANLQNCPDLFPVLAVVCAFAKGRSILYGAPQLKQKESNRIAKTAELLTRAGFSCQPHDDGMEIEGQKDISLERKFTFDPDSDHRLAMAAAILKYKGFKIKIKNSSVVKKSFPEFWSLVGVKP